MHYSVLSPLGVELNVPSLAGLNAEAVRELRQLLADHGVIVIRKANPDDQGFLSFLSAFGELTFAKGEIPLDGFPDLNVVSNVGRTTPPRSVFHVDTSYLSRPPAYTALRAVQIPQLGGQTLFTNQYRAHDTLPADVRVALAGRTITHRMTGLELEAADETVAEHPALLTHPISKRTALYLSTPERCVAVSGMNEADSRDLIAFLYAHSIAADNLYRHSWAAGDVVIWDNRCVMHRADHANVVGDRVMHRGLVASAAS